jgi:hypothetical protein
MGSTVQRQGHLDTIQAKICQRRDRAVVADATADLLMRPHLQLSQIFAGPVRQPISACRNPPKISPRSAIRQHVYSRWHCAAGQDLKTPGKSSLDSRPAGLFRWLRARPPPPSYRTQPVSLAGGSMPRPARESAVFRHKKCPETREFSLLGTLFAP